MAGENAYGPTVDSTASYKRHSHHPLFRVSLGLLMLLIFFWGLLLQIQTSENMLLGQGSVSVSFSNWSVLMQIPTMFTGHYPFEMAMAVFLAYAIEAAYFAALIFHEMGRHAARASGILMEKFYMVGIMLCVLYNMVSDYNCGSLGSGTFGHIAFSLLMTFVEAFFGVVGVALIMRGYREI